MIAGISYFVFFLLILLSGWILWVRCRGSLGYWKRTVSRPEYWVIGLRLDGVQSEKGDSSRLSELAAEVRTLGQESGLVMRQWDHDAGTRFMGLMLRSAPDEVPGEPYFMERLPAGKVLRVSGVSNADGVSVTQAGREWAENQSLKADFSRPARVSGQSFWYYEWEVEESGSVADEPEPLSEWVFRLREIVLYPVLMGAFSLALLGTGNGLLFGTGVLVLIFLSGANKFVFVHQREDESQEDHLQNY